MAKNQPLGIELVKRGIVTGQDIEKALKYQETHRSRKIGDILYILDVADPELLITAVGEILGKKGKYLDINSMKIEPTDYIPFDVMKKNKAVPFAIEAGRIKVAFADVTGSEASIKSIKMLMLNKGLVLDIYIAFQTNVEEFLQKYGNKLNQNMEDIGSNETTTEIIDNVIKLAIEKRASDIHFEPQADSIRIRFRIDGELFIMTNSHNIFRVVSDDSSIVDDFDVIGSDATITPLNETEENESITYDEVDVGNKEHLRRYFPKDEIGIEMFECVQSVPVKFRKDALEVFCDAENREMWTLGTVDKAWSYFLDEIVQEMTEEEKEQYGF